MCTPQTSCSRSNSYCGRTPIRNQRSTAWLSSLMQRVRDFCDLFRKLHCELEQEGWLEFLSPIFQQTVARYSAPSFTTHSFHGALAPLHQKFNFNFSPAKFPLSLVSQSRKLVSDDLPAVSSLKPCKALYPAVIASPCSGGAPLQLPASSTPLSEYHLQVRYHHSQYRVFQCCYNARTVVAERFHHCSISDHIHTVTCHDTVGRSGKIQYR